MENGVGVVNEMGFDGIPREERADGMKDLAGDEIFEEAIEAPAHLSEDGEKVGSVYENGDMAVVDGKFNVEDDDDEKFEEPSGVPVEVDNFETAMPGSSDFREDRLVGEGERKEEPDVDADGGDKILGASNQEDKMSGVVIEQLESRDPGDEDLVEMPESTKLVNLEIDRVKGDALNLNHGSKQVVELKENSCVELQDEKPRDLADTSAGTHSFLRDEANDEELKGNLAKLEPEHQVDESAEPKDVLCSQSSADLATGHQDERNEKVEVSLDELDTQNHVGTCELKDTWADLSTSVDKVTVTHENEIPDKTIIEDKENIISDSTGLKAEDSDYSDETARKEEKTPEKSIMEKDTEIQDEATSLRAEGYDFVEDIAQEKGKNRERIQENGISLREENSNFSDETAKKDENLITDKDGKIKEDSTDLTVDGSVCANDSAREKSITEEIEEGSYSSRSVNSDFANETAHKVPNNNILAEELTIEKDEKIKDDSTGLMVDGSDCANAQEEEKILDTIVTEKIKEDETAHEVPNNHVPVEEPGKKEEEAKKENIQAKGLPEFQPASRLASSSGKFTKPASSPAPSPSRPAGLGRAAPLLDPAPRSVQQPRVNGTASQTQTQHMEDSNGEAEENDETREKLQMIRVKFLRLAYRLGQTPHNVVVAQVLYRLGLAEQLRGRNGGRVGAFSFDRASAMAEQLEAAGQEPLDFSCTILVLGKTGVGKSATINSIFDEHKFGTDAFVMGTKKVQDVVGTVQGIKVRVIDTPGLLSSWSDQRQNEKILLSVKRFIKKTPPDIVLYLDRLDMQSRDFGDMPLLRTITQIFGASIWFNAIVVLTHAASAPPDGPNGTASSYDMFVTQRSHVVQQAIRQAAGDMRLMNPVSLVENHSACRTNRAGQRVLPNGQVWKPHLLLLSFASKILAEANTLLKLLDSPPGKPSATRTRSPPLPFLLSSLLQSRPQLKLPGELGDEDDDLVESSDSDTDDESEYDELPPFTPLTKAQMTLLSKAQRKAYFDELAYRERLFMKKQLKEEKRQRRMMKRMADLGQKRPSYDNSENVEESSAEISPAPMPDLALPASFDSSNPSHRYRCLDSANQWVVRPVLDTHGWDHDVGYEGINVERFFVVKDKLPVAFSGQASKDKKDVNIQMEINSSLTHGEGKSTSMGFDLQSVGKDMAYTMRGETKFCNHRRNKASAGLSLTLLGDALSTGVKLEDKLIVNKCFRIVMAGGAMSGRGDVAYGGSLEAQLRDSDYPLGRFLSTLGLSIMDWHGDLAIGGNVQSQVPIGRSTNLIARANLNNRGAGQISVRLNSSEQLQIALFGFIPLLRKVLDQLSHIGREQQ